ncbi:MAG: hypothetical protein HPY67_01815 [Syntrophaceae bacterium]|nr:hypothetical protein [Syntrophaceae bacterium]
MSAHRERRPRGRPCLVPWALLSAALAFLLFLCPGPAASQQTEKVVQPLQTQEKLDLKPLPEKKPAQTAPAAQKPTQAVIPGVVTKQPQPASTPPVTLPSKGTLQKLPLPFPAATPAVKTPTASQPAATTPGMTTVPGTQKPAGTATPAKGATQPAPCPAVQPVVQRVAQLKAKLGPYLRSTYDFINLGRQMKQAGHQAQQAAFKPYPGTAALPQGGTGVTPATPRQTSGVTAVTPRQTGMTELQNMQRIRGEAQRVHGNGLREAGEIRGVLSALNGEIRKLASCSSLTAQERQSLRVSADSLNTETATMKAYGNALQAQSNDYASQLSAQQVLDPQYCGGCNLSVCQSCCAEKNRVTGAPGSALRAQQESNLSQCRTRCEVQAAICDAASDMNRRNTDFLNMGSDIRKSVTESQTTILGKIRG